MSKCLKCGKELTPIDVGLSKKLINRGTTEYFCKACLAEKFGVTEALPGALSSLPSTRTETVKNGQNERIKQKRTYESLVSPFLIKLFIFCRVF